MNETRAFSPCHITGLFQIFDEVTDPLQVGSRGAGVSLKHGVETVAYVEEASEDFVEIRINGVNQDPAEVSKCVVRLTLSRCVHLEHFEITVDHKVAAPIGAGFGTSGAAALSLALALNEAMGLDLSRLEAAQMAHVAEVTCRTGLGTVIAETLGGVEVRVKPGGPGIGEIRHIPASDDMVVACLAFGPLSTRESLADPRTRKRINEFGGNLVDRLSEKPGITNFLRLSRQFAEHVDLISNRVRRVMNEADHADFTCSMPMFGDSVFTVVHRESLEGILKIYREHCLAASVFVSDIDFEGARLLT